MAKTITCDVCGAEMPDGRTKHEIKHETRTSFADRPIKAVTITVGLTRTVDGVGSDVCLGCIREAVAHGIEVRKALRG